MIIAPPKKPFLEYKWRWAVFTPTEGLNAPPVFLGVLRALRKCEGYRPNSPEFIQALGIVQEETHTSVSLSRTGNRNLIRNSGQYWKAFDLLQRTRPGIELSDFGKRVADGKITALEFAVTVVKTLELPNTLIFSTEEIAQWGDLRFKPLNLILEILSGLNQYNSTEAYLTPYELRRIVIPLAGDKALIEEYPEAIINYRNGTLIIDNWPDCTPDSNDKRMAREFLLFLNNYGLCRMEPSVNNDEEKYFLNGIERNEIEDFDRIDTFALPIEETFEKVRRSKLITKVERKKIQTTIYARPFQSQFRDDVLSAFNSKCLISGATLPAVLEAAHIIPVPNDGQDSINNGFCFRSDIHRLFDTGHLRIDISGNIFLSETAALMNNYGSLPKRIVIPAFILRDNVEWRWNYY